MAPRRPLVLCIAGHDPGGGAGIQADIETVAALGGHALTAISAYTVQDTRDVARAVAADGALLREQLDALLADSRIDAVKIGLVGDASHAAPIAAAVRRAGAPVVLDPVLRAGGGADLATPLLLESLLRQLLPLVDVLTPNAAEARRMVPGAADLDGCAAALLAHGARHVLITGGDEPGEGVINRWYVPGRPARRHAWPRLAGPFHGAGCTLASAIATLLAHGLPVSDAVTDAQAYTHRALERAFAPGRGRKVPGRVEG